MLCSRQFTFLPTPVLGGNRLVTINFDCLTAVETQITPYFWNSTGLRKKYKPNLTCNFFTCHRYYLKHGGGFFRSSGLNSLNKCHTRTVLMRNYFTKTPSNTCNRVLLNEGEVSLASLLNTRLHHTSTAFSILRKRFQKTWKAYCTVQ